MSSEAENTLKASLEEFIEPHYGTDLASAGALREISATGKQQLDIELGFPADGYADDLKSALQQWLAERGHEVTVNVSWRVREHAVQGTLQPLKGIRNIIAIASGKGGVGKSTTAANLALALAADGAKVGMLDADIYGPSQPRMLGMSGKPVSHDGKTMEPMENHGIKCMSIGFLVDEDQPMVWRGPMVTQALTQLLNETNWGELDYLIVDMPPGTGDTQLTMSQRVPLAGAVIVTTPQDIALLDARKGLQMFRKVAVNVLGIVENMSTHICSNCGHEEHIFGNEGGRRMAEQYDSPFLGALPLDIRIREETDSGEPTVISAPESEIAGKYREIARNMSARLAAASSAAGATAFPNITEDDS